MRSLYLMWHVAWPMASATKTIVSLMTAASLDDGYACVERAVFRHGVGVDVDLLCDGIGAQSFAQLLGDLLLHCRGERGTADALALRAGSGHARARPLAD